MRKMFILFVLIFFVSTKIFSQQILKIFEAESNFAVKSGQFKTILDFTKPTKKKKPKKKQIKDKEKVPQEEALSKEEKEEIENQIVILKTIGSSISFQFEGKGGFVTFMSSSNSGIATILLDGEKVEEIDLYGAYSTPQTYKWYLPMLKFEQQNKLHNLVIAVGKGKNANSTGNDVMIDSVTITDFTFAQFSGKVVDEFSDTQIVMARVELLPVSEKNVSFSTYQLSNLPQNYFCETDYEGNFYISGIVPNKYFFNISYFGYEDCKSDNINCEISIKGKEVEDIAKTKTFEFKEGANLGEYKFALRRKNWVTQNTVIILPNIGIPAIVKSGKEFQVIINDSLVSSQLEQASKLFQLNHQGNHSLHPPLPFSFKIYNEHNQVELKISSFKLLGKDDQRFSIRSGGKNYEVVLKVPETTPTGMFNLYFQCCEPIQRGDEGATGSNKNNYKETIDQEEGIKDVNLNSVYVIDKQDEEKKSLKIAHITDVHIGESPEAIEVYKKVIEEINILNPDIIINTGDSFDASGYYEAQIPKSKDETGKWVETTQIVPFIYATSFFEKPHFIIPGNHDLSPREDENALKRWESYFNNRFYSLNYRNIHFTFIDNNSLYIPLMQKKSFREEMDSVQLKWLEDDLKNAPRGKMKTMLYHVSLFDRKVKINDFYEKYEVSLVLYGHLHANKIDELLWNEGMGKTTFVQTAAEKDGYYRLIEIKEGKEIIIGEPIKYGNLNVKYNPEAESIFSDEIEAEIENKNNINFSDCILKFIMRHSEKNYTCEGGCTIDKIVPIENFQSTAEFFQITKLEHPLSTKDLRLIYVAFDLQANSSKKIKVKKN